MKHVLTAGAFPLVALVSLSGCIDNNYDLSDIDTTSEFKIKDLIVPINIDPITMGDIFDIKEGDKIQVVTINGQTFYAINEKGSFRSDPVEIPQFSASAPYLTPVTIPLPGEVRKTLSYNVGNVHEAIQRLNEIFIDRATFVIRFAVADVPSGVSLSLDNVALTIPKGLDIDGASPAGNYSYYDGRYSVSHLPLVDGVGEISVSVSKINLEANGCYINNGSFNLTSGFNIEKGDLVVSADTEVTALPTEIAVNVNYSIPEINVKAVSGTIEYTFDGSGLGISPIDLTDIPDFLAGDDTDLILASPQI